MLKQEVQRGSKKEGMEEKTTSKPWAFFLSIRIPYFLTTTTKNKF